MFVSSNSTVGYTAGILAVGLSSTIALPAIAFQNSVHLQYIAGSTIFISGSSASSFGAGRIWGQTTSPTLTYMDYSGPLYFTAGGATALVSWDKTLTDPTL